MYEHLQALLGEGSPVAVATITQVKGSVPREVGAKMIIHPYGRHVGTVGGGCGEADVIRTALDVLGDGAPRTVPVDLTEPVRMESLGVCGGIMSVYVERWDAEAEELPLLAALVEALRTREAVALVTLLEAAGAPRLLVYADTARSTLAEGAPLPGTAVAALVQEARAALGTGEHRRATVTVDTGALQAFIEVQAPPAHLVICGAGHIAVPLARIASLCDYDVTVIDDRAAFANRARFPTATTVTVGDFRAELRALRGGRARLAPRTALALVTRGHQHDVECLLEVIDDGLEYIGMIGSKRRIRAVFDLLQSEYGIPRERFERVFAPVGLDIGSRTPAEIAVAIVGEMINVARSGPGVSLSRPRAKPTKP